MAGEVYICVAYYLGICKNQNDGVTCLCEGFDGPNSRTHILEQVSLFTLERYSNLVQITIQLDAKVWSVRRDVSLVMYHPKEHLVEIAQHIFQGC